MLTDSGGIQEETTALARAVPHDAREHRAAHHRRAGNEHARRPQPRAARCAASTTILAAGGKRGGMPELWDGHAAERIADDFARGSHCPAPARVTSGRMAVHPMNTRDAADGAIVNALTIDVEDYFQVSAFAAHIPRTSWDSLPCRVERNIDRILALLADAGVRATFFTLGWIAERYPAMVRRIVDGGHELASHGYEHCRATDQGYGQFLADIRLAKAVLEDIVVLRGKRLSRAELFGRTEEPVGVRVHRRGRLPLQLERLSDPARSLRRARRPALRARGVEQDCSRCRSRRCACSHANWPAGGGGYFRLLPYGVSRWSLRRVNAVDRQPAIFYFHPWELDPEQPRVEGPSREGAVPPLPQPHAHGAADAAAARPISAGIASTTCSWRAEADGLGGRSRR